MLTFMLNFQFPLISNTWQLHNVDLVFHIHMSQLICISFAYFSISQM